MYDVSALLRQRPAIVLLLSLGFVAAMPAAVPAVTFTDSEFADADWTVTVETINLGGSVSGFHLASGGSPAAFRRIDNTLNSASGQPFSNTVLGFHARNSATWNPSIQGEIASLDYSEDAFRLSGSGQQANGIALRQGGVIYYGPASLTPATPGAWQAAGWSSLTASSFDALAAGTQNPSFTSGGTIEFGFYRSNSTSVGGGGSVVSGGIDNWTVTLILGPTSVTRSTWGRVKVLYRD